MFFAGIDWSEDHHDVVVVGPDREKVASRRVSHSAEGLADLTAWLASLASPQEIACIVETRHGLLIQALLEAGLPVYPVNPLTVDRLRRPSGAKTDALDAWLLARHGCNELDQLRRLEPDTPLLEELKLLTRDRQTLIREHTRLIQQLQACLKAYYPLALSLFGKLSQPVALEFLRTYPTPESIQKATAEEIAALLRKHRYPKAREKAEAILASAHRPQMRASAPTTRAKSRLMLALSRQLAAIGEDIRAYDREIEALFFAHPDRDIFQSLPGAGKRLAPRLFAEWGEDRSRYRTEEGVAALAGASPVLRASGKFKGTYKRYACVKPFRDACYQLAWCSIRWEPWAKEYYQRKRKEGKSHSVALRSLSRIWIRIIYRMWMNHEPYNRNIFLKAQEAHRRVG